MSVEQKMTCYQIKMNAFPGVIFEFAYDANAGLGPSLQHAFGSPGGDSHPAILHAPGSLTSVFIPNSSPRPVAYAVSELASEAGAITLYEPTPPRARPRKLRPEPYEQESF